MFCISYFVSECLTRLPAFIPWTLFSFSLIFQLSGHLVTAQEDDGALSNDAIVQSLGDKWERQRDDLSSVEIDYRSIRRKVPAGHDISRDDVRKLIHRLSKSDDPSVHAEVAIALDPRLKDHKTPWTEAYFTFHGDSYLSEVTYPGGATQLIVKHDGYELHVRPHIRGAKQVSILLPQRGIIYGPRELGDFVVIPPGQFLNKAQVSHVKAEDGDDRFSISNNHVEFIVNAKTGFVYEYRRGQFGNRRYDETLQFTRRLHGKDLVLPALYFQSRYSEKRLSSFSLRLIDKVTMNPNVPLGWYQIAVNEKDVVVDQTGDDAKVIRFSQPAWDVIDLLEDAQARDK